MTDATATAERALAPVRARLLADARAEAEQITATARAQAAAMVRDAWLAAGRAVDRARTDGEAAAAPLAVAEIRHGRARAQAIVLGAQRAAYDELANRVRAAADRLRAEPGYPALLAQLTELATRAAQGGPVVSEEARAAGPAGITVAVPDAGGVVVHAGLSVVDCSLPRLAAFALAGLGDQVRELWTP